MEEWENSEVESSFLRPEDFINAALVRKTLPFAGSPENLPLPSDSDFMVGASSGFLSACHKLRQVAPTNATVLLLGETGVGKERFANMLHRLSARASGPFVALNCAAIPDNLLEAELFGVERGAFTGATESRKGRFERADGGTLFLDEIGTLNEASQAKLLRALQERVIERVGGGMGRAVDVRVVAATNANLSDAVKAGKFRGDLFYRLNVFPIQIPPLRERRDDIALLLDHFVKKFSDAHGKVVSGFTSRAISALLTYDYPGNVRELENLIELGVIMVPNGKAIDRHHLFQAEEFLNESLLGIDKVGEIKPAEAAHFNDPVDETLVTEIAERALDASLSLEALESAAIKEAVRRADGNLSQAARLLGISRAQVAYRLEKHKDE
jgi:transcriptional regulator with PAS, ATPase and Fis domain